jgi:nitrogen-specific signal transduction histidine kinase/CheY-like chemotaxis protein
VPCEDRDCSHLACLRTRLARADAALGAARRTIDVLANRVERPPVAQDADRFALYKSISTLQDIARERGAAAEARDHDYQALVEATPDAIISLDAQQRVLSANPAAARLLGLQPGGLEGRALGPLLGHTSAAALTGLLWSGFAGVGDSELELDDGRRLSFSVARLPEGRVLLVMRDVTRVHHQELEVRRSRRLASAGRLASGLVQEITTPLSIVQGRVGLVRAKAERPEAVRRQAGVIEEHCRRIAAVMRNLQSFIAPRPLEQGWHAVEELFQEARETCGRKLERVRLQIQITPRGLQVHADREQLVQALCNLLMHVAERSPAGSPVRLLAERGDAGEGAVELTLEDRAGTLPPELLAELRSPYAEGERQFDPDLGLGLAIAWAIAQDHEGWLTAAELDGGVALRLGLPGPSSTVPAGGGGESAGRHILVVDDDQLLRETVSWMLAEQGHTISTVASAEEALTWMARQQPDAVLVDIGLPGMRGDDLVDAIAERWPGLASRAIVTSGLLHAPRQGEAYLQKPFTRAQLLRVLDRLPVD